MFSDQSCGRGNSHNIVARLNALCYSATHNNRLQRTIEKGPAFITSLTFSFGLRSFFWDNIFNAKSSIKVSDNNKKNPSNLERSSTNRIVAQNRL